MNTRSGTGILYVAFGRKYVEEAVQSVRTIKAHMPKTPIALVTDEATPEAEALFDSIIVRAQEHPAIGEMHWGYYNKICGLEASPFTRTLFLDADIHCACEVEECFTMLERKTVVAVPTPPRDRSPESFHTANPLPPFNSGVLGLNFDKLPADFFAAWKQDFIDHCLADPETQTNDLVSLRRLAWNQNIDILLLDYAYNFRFAKPALFCGPVKLLHGRASNADKIARLLNVTTLPRIYLPHVALLVSDHDKREWIVYPLEAPDEPSRISQLGLSDALLMIAEENGIDREAAATAIDALKAAAA